MVNLLESAGFSRANPYYVVQQGKVGQLPCLLLPYPALIWPGSVLAGGVLTRKLPAPRASDLMLFTSCAYNTRLLAPRLN